MSDAPNDYFRLPRRLTDDPQFTVRGDTVDFASMPHQPVRLSEIRVDGVLMGWLWADDSADAASFMPLAERDPDSSNLGVAWVQRLRDAKARGLSPTQALIEAAEDGPSGMGQAGPLSDEPIPFEQLTAMAGEFPRPEPVSRDRRR